MAAVGRVLTGVVATAPPGTEAVIWRRPRVEVRPPAFQDFWTCAYAAIDA